MNDLKSRFLASKLILYSAILAFFGFLDSIYLVIAHYKNIIPPCSVHFGCEKVLTSTFSMIGPFPLALFGVLFYLTVVFFCLLLLIEGLKQLLPFFHLLVAIGFFASVVLFVIQFWILQSFCQYCLLSEVISTGLFALSLLKIREEKTR